MFSIVYENQIIDCERNIMADPAWARSMQLPTKCVSRLPCIASFTTGNARFVRLAWHG